MPSTSQRVSVATPSSRSRFDSFREFHNDSAESPAITRSSSSFGQSTFSEHQTYSNMLQTIQPYPKAPTRKETRRGRKKRRSAILTDSPVRRSLSAEQEKSQQKKAIDKANPKPRGRPRGRKSIEDKVEPRKTSIRKRKT